MKDRILLSIIIVNYKVEKELIDCTLSIIKSKPKVKFEIIIVDNQSKSKLETAIKAKIPIPIRYIKSSKNIGYGAGCNLGAKLAKGEYLFFINPDTLVFPKTIDGLIGFMQKKKNAGIAAPLLVDINNDPYQQGTKNLGFIEGIVALSFLNKLFPKNPISKNYFLSSWNKRETKEVDVVPGTAFVIKKNIFEKINGFDENFFLYFEEFDLCKRVKKIGYKIFIIPDSKVMHFFALSTKKSNLDIASIFKKSRFYYFKKHYGFIKALVIEAFSRLNKITFSLSVILAVGTFLRIYKLSELMPFIGDYGWFYLSARDMVLTGTIPLVGIASSHPWLHQGPLWTYMLSFVFWIFGFNPLNGAYLTVVLGIFSILLIYIVGSEMFSKKIGLISAVFYTTSPLVIIHSRTPYHTSPIPLFTLLFIFSVFKLLKGKIVFFPFAVFFLGILYNFELATSILWLVLITVLGYGLWKKKTWFKKTLDKKIFLFSAMAFLVPMAPIIIYDFNHGFSQTFKFILWIFYRSLKFIGVINNYGAADSSSLSSMISFSFKFYQLLIFSVSGIFAFIILLFCVLAVIINIYNFFKSKKYDRGFVLLILWIVISFFGYIVNKTPSEAYLPIFFPALIFIFAFSLDKIMKKKILFILSVGLIIFISLINSYSLISSNYFTNGLNFSQKLSIAKDIVKNANGRKYNLVGVGKGSEFASFTMNYEYLSWWLGNPPTTVPQKLKYIIKEND